MHSSGVTWRAADDELDAARAWINGIQTGMAIHFDHSIERGGKVSAVHILNHRRCVIRTDKPVVARGSF